jgi:hypothetical protein
MQTVEAFRERLPSSSRAGEFLYHVTTADAIPSIREEGLDPLAMDTRRCPAEFVLHELSRNDPITGSEKPLPFDRRLSAFAWPSLPETVYDGGAVVVLRTDALDNRLYLGEHDLIDGILIDAPMRRALDDGDVEALREALVRYYPSASLYLRSVELVSDAESLSEATNILMNPEVVIEGHVTPDAIETVLMPERADP